MSTWAPSVVFIARHSGKALDFTTNGSGHATQQEINNGPGQTFYLHDAGNGYVNIVNKQTKKYLDVSGGSKDNGAEIIEWSPHGGENQQWRLEDAGEGHVTITARHSGKVLDVNGVSKDNGAKIFQWEKNGGHNQHWRMERVKSDEVVIRSKDSNLVLEASSLEQGAKIFQKPQNGNNKQIFKLHPTGDGYYQLESQNGRAIDVSGANTNDGAELILWDKHTGSNQQFKPVHRTGGWFSLEPKHVHEAGGTKTIGVPDNGDETQNLRIWDFQGDWNDQQLWRIEFV